MRARTLSTAIGMKVMKESRARLQSVNSIKKEEQLMNVSSDPFIAPIYEVDIWEERTLLSQAEQLVCFPCHNTFGQARPAPFQYTAEHYRINESKFLFQFIAAKRHDTLRRRIEIVADKYLDGTGFWQRPKW